MTLAKKLTFAACLTALAAGAAVTSAQARDLTVVSWGGNYQDAQKKIYFEPFAKKTGKPVLDESWDGGRRVGTVWSGICWRCARARRWRPLCRCRQSRFLPAHATF